jgi:hypothetical protein
LPAAQFPPLVGLNAFRLNNYVVPGADLPAGHLVTTAQPVEDTGATCRDDKRSGEINEASTTSLHLASGPDE